MFIVLEGIDGCGKTTQAKLIYDWLLKTGGKVVLTAEPTKNGIGNFIRELLSTGQKIDPRSLALLFTADRNEHLGNFIEPNLREGNIVVSERYYHSTIAYQSAQGVDRNWLFEINSFARKPDIVLFIDVKPERAIEKIKEKNIKIEEDLKRHLDVLKEEYRLCEQERRKGIAEIINGRKDILSYTPAQIVKRVDEGYKKFEEKKEEYENERRKYLKLEHFEQPIAFESDNYESFLTKVYENYKQFTEMTLVNGNQPVENVFEEIKAVISRVL